MAKAISTTLNVDLKNIYKIGRDEYRHSRLEKHLQRVNYEAESLKSKLEISDQIKKATKELEKLEFKCSLLGKTFSGFLKISNLLKNAFTLALVTPFKVALGLAGKLFETLRSIVMLPFDVFSFFDTGSTRDSLKTNRSGYTRNTSGRNIKALENAEALNGVSLNLDAFANTFSDYDKAGDFAHFGITNQMDLGEGDHITAAFQLLPQIIDQIKRDGGFDGAGSARPLHEQAASNLGFSWDELKALSESGILSRLRKDFEDQRRTLGYSDKAFERNSRAMQGFSFAIDNFKDKILLQLIPILTPIMESLKSVFDGLGSQIAKSGAMQKLKVGLTSMSESFSKWLKDDGISKLQEWFDKLLEALRIAVKGFLYLATWLPDDKGGGAAKKALKAMEWDESLSSAVNLANMGERHNLFNLMGTAKNKYGMNVTREEANFNKWYGSSSFGFFQKDQKLKITFENKSDGVYLKARDDKGSLLAEERIYRITN